MSSIFSLDVSEITYTCEATYRESYIVT